MNSFIPSCLSEESMAAFIDGMLSPEEMVSFQKDVLENPLMKELLEGVQSAVTEPSVSALDDYPGLLPEETISSIMPVIQDLCSNRINSIELLNNVQLPMPIIEDLTEMVEDIDGMPYQNEGSEYIIPENDGSMLGEQDAGEISIEQ